jgi:hypothetical protein
MDTVDHVPEHGFEGASRSVPPGVKIPTHCSFCGRPRSELSGMVAGPPRDGVAICHDCIELCAELMHEERAERAKRNAV